MKVILMVLFVSQGDYNSGNVEILQYEMPDISHCESVSGQIKTIFEEDPIFNNTEVSLKCVEIAK